MRAHFTHYMKGKVTAHLNTSTNWPKFAKRSSASLGLVFCCHRIQLHDRTVRGCGWLASWQHRARQPWQTSYRLQTHISTHTHNFAKRKQTWTIVFPKAHEGHVHHTYRQVTNDHNQEVSRCLSKHILHWSQSRGVTFKQTHITLITIKRCHA